MFDVSTFLIRWLFLSHLARDVTEIQTLPVMPYFPHHQHDSSSSNPLDVEAAWKEHCLRGIFSRPPGKQRLYIIDAFRVEIVKQLAQKLKQTDDIMAQQRLSQEMKLQHAEIIEESSQFFVDENFLNGGSDPFHEDDVEILNTFRDEHDDHHDSAQSMESSMARLVISQDGTGFVSSNVEDTNENETEKAEEKMSSPFNLNSLYNDCKEIPIPLEADLYEASCCLQQFREYLPQLVSAALKSPPAFEPHLANPVQLLKDLLLVRCLLDPTSGIEMCWLLEAEVGRAWKSLFEHRQQTGRRLIIVFPADTAKVIAKIGNEKQEAFELLQEAEKATAYGYSDTVSVSTLLKQLESLYESKQQDSHQKQRASQSRWASRLPASLSLKRCSHFGDTMHFIDRLTKISLDLRAIPIVQRTDCLHDFLHEMNRKLRRRMITRGGVSLDVEDNHGSYDWPRIEDLTLDKLQYSVHLPLIPQTGTWPSSDTCLDMNTEMSPSKTIHQLVRVLNIVVSESRLLTSRERCPFLLHLEVADTNLEGCDARLYAASGDSLGMTMEEALRMSSIASTSKSAKQHTVFDRLSLYNVPPELFMTQRLSRDCGSTKAVESKSNKAFPRGGWQEVLVDTDFPGEFDDKNNFHSALREEDLEQLHREFSRGVNNVASSTRIAVSIGDELLHQVFGPPWNEKCREIREASPFGHIKGWRLASFIIKAGEDIRREALVMQIISKLRTWFNQEIQEAFRPTLRPYTIMCVGGDAGLLECLSDAKSIDEIKKRVDNFVSLREFFKRAYGRPKKPLRAKGKSISFEVAQDNFLRSLVGYSLVCYILQIKDRHNGNILLDREGHIMHIDFGFVLGDTPKMGKVPLFNERAPFKLNGELWEVLGGWNVQQGGLGVRFCQMFELAFACASVHADEIASLVEGTMLALNHDPRIARSIASGICQRLRMRGTHGSRDQKLFIVNLVNAALTSWGTSTYDWLQRNMNGYQ